MGRGAPMLERIEHRIGLIDIERPVAAKIIKESVIGHREVFALTNAKGQTSSILRKISFDRNADFIMINKDKQGRIEIRLFVILMFGVPISVISEELIKNIRKDLLQYLQMEPELIEIRVVGLKTKKYIAERDIVIRDRLTGEEDRQERP